MTAMDRVAPEIREVDRQVDVAYRSNPLLKRPLSEAAWYFLAHCEEVQFKEHIKSLFRMMWENIRSAPGSYGGTPGH